MTGRRAELGCALRLARRELRGGIGGLRVFLACLALGVAAIAAIGSVTAAVNAGIAADARALLGGDVAVRLALRPAGAAERAYLAASGTLSEVALLRAMARANDGNRRSLIQLKAVDAAYPLYGALALMPAAGGNTPALAAALERRDGVFGAVADPAVASRLHVAEGDRFLIGEAAFELRGRITREPDAALNGLMLGPRVIVAAKALADTGLLRPGVLVDYDYRLRLPPGADASAWAAETRARFPEAGWRLRTAADAAPSLRRLIGRIGFFLDLVGVTTLLVGGIGIANAVAFYVASKTQTIATLKCLGAPNRLVFALYFVQILALALGGIAAALVVGGLAPAALAPLLAGQLPVALPFALHPAPLAGAALCGLLTTLVFALWPLAAVGRVMPGALFRDLVIPAPRPFARIAMAGSAAAALALAAFVVLAAPDRGMALWYVGAALAAFALFRGAAALAVALARRLGRCRLVARHAFFRLAVANLYRPGAPTARIVMSLGLGLGVLAAIALVDGNLAVEIDTRLAERAPAFFFVDIQPDQLAGFEDIVRGTPGASLDEVPMLRGRITRLNGVAVGAASVAPGARWAVESDRGITYAGRLPQGSELVAGSWWPADYRGAPLVSFDESLARGMGLKVGDTLSVNLLGREITARIANLRRIDWSRLGINFAIVFAPGTLEAAPQTHLAAAYVPAAGEEGLVRRVTDRYPNVSAIPVREALAAVARVVARIGGALRLTALLTLGAGLLVLGGAVAASHRLRVYDAVVLKVLGATRRSIGAAFLVEHGLVGLLTAIAAALFGTLAAYLLVTRALRMEWAFLPRPLSWMLGLAGLVTLALGFAATWRALGAKPAPYLRHP